MILRGKQKENLLLKNQLSAFIINQYISKKPDSL